MTTTSDNEYNQRESANLMNIVAVVYGVALTTALSLRPDVLLHPLSVSNTIASLALLAAGLLTALSFFSYVLVIGGDTPYRIAWNLGSSGGGSVIRFLADLLLAVLYVRLLFAAAGVGTGAGARTRWLRIRLHPGVHRRHSGATAAPSADELDSADRGIGGARAMGPGTEPQGYAWL